MSTKAIAIGGSAGSFQVVLRMLELFRPTLPVPVFLCLHRLKQVRSGFQETLDYNATLTVKEPYDKENIQPGRIYLAPANYHMLIEKDFSIALSTANPVLHSRPSIDVCFASAADVYENGLLAILLSGANQDGTSGIACVKSNGGSAVIQDPEDCEISTMCESAIKLTKPDQILTVSNLIEFVSLI